MRIEFTKEEAKDVVHVLKMNLDYWIYESNCANEYFEEIDASIMLLRKFGHKDEADQYQRDYDKALEDVDPQYLW